MIFSVLLDSSSSDIWHDPLLLAILGIIATLLAGLLSAFLAFWVSPRLTKKELTYEIISDTPVASINEKLENRFKILVDGNPVNNANLLVLKVRNSGRSALKPEDYFDYSLA